MATRGRMKVCTYCQKTFVKTEHLLRHERSHTGDKPYQCRTCGRRYARRDVLLRHEKVFHGPNSSADRRGSMGGEMNHGKDAAMAPDDRNSTSNQPMNSPGSNFEMRMDRTYHSISPDHHHQSLIECSNSMDMQMLGTADLDALATVSIAQAHQKNYSISSDAQIRSMGQLIDPALAATPRSLDAGMRNATGSFTGDVGDASSHVPRVYDSQPAGMETPNLDGGFEAYSSNNIFGRLDMADFNAAAESLLLERGYLDTNLDRASNIPLERFALVARLWPNNKSRLAEQQHRSSIWKEIADFTGDNILDVISPSKTSPTPSCDREHEVEWTLDEEKRRGLVLDLNASSSVRYGTDETSFPSLKLLNLSLNAVFRQASSLLPFIHQPTFSPKLAPSLIVMPLCLLGMLLLHSLQARAIAARDLPGVTQACCQQFGSASQGQGTGAKIVALLISGVILLRAWAIFPAQSQQHEELARTLHMQTILLAKNSSLFTRSDDSRRAEEIMAQVKGAAATPPNDDGMWKIWARIESVKRLVTTLITMDCWWSHSLGHCPMMRAAEIRFEQPCPTELYRAVSAKFWQRLINADNGVLRERMPPTVVNSALNAPPPQRQGVSPVGIIGSLSTIWLSILEAQSGNSAVSGNEITLSEAGSGLPIQESSRKEIARMLVDEYFLHASDFRFRNPNCIALWHFLNINIYADLEIFNKAAGRGGAENAHEALQSIASWSRTAEARRACLHAAGIHASMNRRRPKDGIMLHTELCIFSAALVLGLYVFMMASDSDSTSDGHLVQNRVDDDPYELLDDVAWPLLGDGAFDTSRSSASLTSGQQDSAARRFLREGGTISFSGILCEGGYNTAKRIMLDYASLLEEVSKWDASGLCRVLRIMSDSLLEV